MPPTPPISSTSITRYSDFPQTTITKATQRLIRTTSANADSNSSSIQTQNPPLTASGIVSNINLTKPTIITSTPVDVLLSPHSVSTTSKQLPASAPQTPRVFATNSGAGSAATGSETVTTSIGYISQRKFSDQFEPSVAISAMW